MLQFSKANQSQINQPTILATLRISHFLPLQKKNRSSTNPTRNDPPDINFQWLPASPGPLALLSRAGQRGLRFGRARLGLSPGADGMGSVVGWDFPPKHVRRKIGVCFRNLSLVVSIRQTSEPSPRFLA